MKKLQFLIEIIGRFMPKVNFLRVLLCYGDAVLRCCSAAVLHIICSFLCAIDDRQLAICDFLFTIYRL
jgi:hypothetical protein